jgi:Ca2+-binding RTX toxin-like protein
VVAVQPTAGLSGATAAVSGQPLTYFLVASEPALPFNTIYSFSFQWGDGTPVQTLSGPSGTPVSHVFTTTGTFMASLTATDPSGNASVPYTMSVAVTTVLWVTDPLNSGLTDLYVGGTTGNDNIAITPAIVNNVIGVKLGMNFVNYGNFFPTGHVVIYGQSGNDIIKTAPQSINGVLTYVTIPVMIFAGNGNDILNVSGSAATDGPGNALGNVLVGGSGADTLIGGQGRDILIGGSGPSTLKAGSGGDILIGGTTNYDGNSLTLETILAEWTSGFDYATRIAHLMSGGGLNFQLLNSSTVHADGQVNDLYGGPGMDWYFAGMMDVLFNKTSGEVVTQV